LRKEEVSIADAELYLTLKVNRTATLIIQLLSLYIKRHQPRRNITLRTRMVAMDAHVRRAVQMTLIEQSEISLKLKYFNFREKFA